MWNIAGVMLDFASLIVIVAPHLYQHMIYHNVIVVRKFQIILAGL